MDWGLTVSVAVGVLGGAVALIVLVMLVIWLWDHIHKWRTGKKQDQHRVAMEVLQQEVRDQTLRIASLTLELVVKEAERERLEHLARGHMLSTEMEPQSSTSQVRTRYERLVEQA